MESSFIEIQVNPLRTRHVVTLWTFAIKGNVTTYYMMLLTEPKTDFPYQLHPYYAAICLEKGTLAYTQ